MRTLLRLVFAMILCTGITFGQNGELSILHGLPGLSGSIDVLVDGLPSFTGVDFGDEASADFAAGSYTVDFVDAGGVLLSGIATVVDGERTTVAAHLTSGGVALFSTFVDDRSAVAGPGNGRLRFRHLADSSLIYWGMTSSAIPTTLNLMGPMEQIEFEPLADDYAIQADEVDLTNFVFPFPSDALSTGVLTLMEDADITINLVGTPGQSSFGFIIQSMPLAPRGPSNVAYAPDLTISGSLIGSTIDIGGVLNLSLTEAPANSIVAAFLSNDNVPFQYIPGVTFGIGGLTGLLPICYGQANAFGTSTESFFLPGFPISLLGISTTFYVQAVAVDISVNGTPPAYMSDVEAFSIGF